MSSSLNPQVFGDNPRPLVDSNSLCINDLSIVLACNYFVPPSTAQQKHDGNFFVVGTNGVGEVVVVVVIFVLAIVAANADAAAVACIDNDNGNNAIINDHDEYFCCCYYQQQYQK